jgi:hypothetical protein
MSNVDKARKSGGSAFPSHGSMGEVVNVGMTLRDYFAAKAMQAMTHRGDGDMYFSSLQAYKMADAMLKAREQ